MEIALCWIFDEVIKCPIFILEQFGTKKSPEQEMASYSKAITQINQETCRVESNISSGSFKLLNQLESPCRCQIEVYNEGNYCHCTFNQ